MSVNAIASQSEPRSCFIFAFICDRVGLLLQGIGSKAESLLIPSLTARKLGQSG